jgi:poly(A) polymerase
VSFHHHEVVGASMAKRRLAALRYPKDVVAAVGCSPRCTCASTATTPGAHGPSPGGKRRGPTRRCAATSPTPAPAVAAAQAGALGLHHPQPPPRRRPRAAYDDLEARIARLAEQEELDRIRPDLDGTR